MDSVVQYFLLRVSRSSFIWQGNNKDQTRFCMNVFVAYLEPSGVPQAVSIDSQSLNALIDLVVHIVQVFLAFVFQSFHPILDRLHNQIVIIGLLLSIPPMILLIKLEVV